MMMIMEGRGSRARLMLQRSASMAVAKEARRRRRGSAVEETGLGAGGKERERERRRRERERGVGGSIDDSGYVYLRRSDADRRADALAGFLIDDDDGVAGGNLFGGSRVSIVREEGDEREGEEERDGEGGEEERDGEGGRRETKGGVAGWLSDHAKQENVASVMIQKRARGLFEWRVVAEMKV